jgi:hypothetical protein
MAYAILCHPQRPEFGGLDTEIETASSENHCL